MTFHFQIGVVPVSLRCAHAPAMHDFRDLYGRYETGQRHRDAIQIDVRRSRDRSRVWKRFEVWADGERRYTFRRKRAILPHIEWAINWQIMRFLPRFYEVHAGVLEVDGRGVIFPATTGSGKSTLTAGLLARGWRYLSDEFALIDPESLCLHPYPKAICIKKGSFTVLDELEAAPRRRPTHVHRRKGRVIFVDPADLGRLRSDPCPVRDIIFCSYKDKGSPSIKPISRAEAVLRLNGQSFNFMKFRARGIEIMSDLARRARCHELVAGPIAETCDLVESVVRKQAGVSAGEAYRPQR